MRPKQNDDDLDAKYILLLKIIEKKKKGKVKEKRRRRKKQFEVSFSSRKAAKIKDRAGSSLRIKIQNDNRIGFFFFRVRVN